MKKSQSIGKDQTKNTSNGLVNQRNNFDDLCGKYMALVIINGQVNVFSLFEEIQKLQAKPHAEES